MYCSSKHPCVPVPEADALSPAPQGKTSQLEALLAAKEAELAALRDQLSQSANASSSGMHSSGDLQVRMRLC